MAISSNCPNCGAPVRPRAKSCPSCGSFFLVADTSFPEQETIEEDMVRHLKAGRSEDFIICMDAEMSRRFGYDRHTKDVLSLSQPVARYVLAYYERVCAWLEAKHPKTEADFAALNKVYSRLKNSRVPFAKLVTEGWAALYLEHVAEFPAEVRADVLFALQEYVRSGDLECTHSVVKANTTDDLIAVLFADELAAKTAITLYLAHVVRPFGYPPNHPAVLKDMRITEREASSSKLSQTNVPWYRRWLRWPSSK